MFAFPQRYRLDSEENQNAPQYEIDCLTTHLSEDESCQMLDCFQQQALAETD